MILPFNNNKNLAQSNKDVNILWPFRWWNDENEFCAFAAIHHEKEEVQWIDDDDGVGGREG
jgi:hypothetical protein